MRLRDPLLATAFVVAATIAVFSPALTFNYTDSDDYHYIEEPHLRGGLTWSNVKWALSTTSGDFRQPLTWLSFLAESSVGAEAPQARHLTNVALHAVNGALVCLLLWQLGVPAPLAAAATLVFWIHPLRLEAVASIAGRKELLFVFFALLSVLSYVTSSPGAMLFYALAVSSKPSALVLPALLLALDYWPLGRWGKTPVLKLVAEKWAFWLLSAFTIVSTARTEPINMWGYPSLGWWSKTEVAAQVLGTYLRKTVLPPWRDFPYSALGVDPDFPIRFGAVIASAAAVVLITAVVYSRRRKAPWHVTGWAWFVASLVPFLGFLRFSPAIGCDRYTYLAHIGFILALGKTLSDIRRPRISLAAAAVAVCLLVPVTWNNLFLWRDSDSFYQQWTTVNPNSLWARTGFGCWLMRVGDNARAVEQFSSALESHPKDAFVWNNRGVALAFAGERTKALADFDQALALRSDARVTANRSLVKSARAGDDPSLRRLMVLVEPK